MGNIWYTNRQDIQKEGQDMLELKNIGFQAEDEKEILRNVNLKIEDNIVVITGPNGGGKSTLAKVLSGIVRPTSGQIFLDGEVMSR